MVTVLRIAAEQPCEAELGQTLLQQAQANTLPDLKALQAQFLETNAQPEITAKQHDITGYDDLLSGHWASSQQQGGHACHSRSC